mgnify:FL=1
MGRKDRKDSETAQSEARLAAAAVAERWVVVSRHPATLEFIRREMPDEFGRAHVVTGDATPTVEDVAGALVIGTIPLNLAAYAVAVYAIEFERTPQRGTDYTLDGMDAAGASIHRYAVKCESNYVWGGACPAHNWKL